MLWFRLLEVLSLVFQYLKTGKNSIFIFMYIGTNLT